MPPAAMPGLLGPDSVLGAAQAAAVMSAPARRLLWMLVRHRPVARAIVTVRRRRLTYLSLGALLDLADRVLAAEAARRPGVLVEAGCALGGSALVMAAAKAPDRPLKLFDTFGQIPPPSDADGADVQARYQTIAAGDAAGLGGDAYYGYVPDLRQRVAATLAAAGYPPRSSAIELIEGLYADTLMVAEAVTVAHIDCDWYESVRTCLERLAERLVPGGVLVVDDYDSWSGCRRAVDEYFAGREGEFRLERHTRLQVVRRSARDTSRAWGRRRSRMT